MKLIKLFGAFFLLLLLLFSCQDKQVLNAPVVEQSLESIARDIIKDAKNCALITTDNLGLSYARPMDPFLPDDEFTIWMATNPKSSKVKQIAYNPRATLYYFDAKNGAYVTLQGLIELVDNPMEKEKHWKDEWTGFYKNKTTDYLLLKFKPSHGFLISEKHKILGDSITWAAPKLDF